jgi:hypothetical protein
MYIVCGVLSQGLSLGTIQTSNFLAEKNPHMYYVLHRKRKKRLDRCCALRLQYYYTFWQAYTCWIYSILLQLPADVRAADCLCAAACFQGAACL